MIKSRRQIVDTVCEKLQDSKIVEIQDSKNLSNELLSEFHYFLSSFQYERLDKILHCS